MSFASGFNMQEAQDAIRFCMQLNGTGIGGMDPLPVASTWTLIYDSRQTDPSKQESRFLSDGSSQPISGMGPFDNAWATWQDPSDERINAIAIRGTVSSASSILDDVLATSVHANAPLPIAVSGNASKQLPIFCVADNNAEVAGVHLGFTWGAAILLYHEAKGVLRHLFTLPERSQILLTGHSQGAAIATLLHAMLVHASTDAVGSMPDALKQKGFTYKSYVFAQPKPGNWAFGHDFARVAGNLGMALCVNNSRDWVPQVPLTLDMPDEVTGNPIDAYLSSKHPILKRLADIAEAGARDARDAVGEVAKLAARRATTYLGSQMPKGTYLRAGPVPDNTAPYLNYVQCGRLLSLEGQAGAEERTDPLWQHHCGNYYRLLTAQGGAFR